MSYPINVNGYIYDPKRAENDIKFESMCRENGRNPCTTAIALAALPITLPILAIGGIIYGVGLGVKKVVEKVREHINKKNFESAAKEK